jgi:hypothetical protein
MRRVWGFLGATALASVSIAPSCGTTIRMRTHIASLKDVPERLIVALHQMQIQPARSYFPEIKGQQHCRSSAAFTKF